MNKYKLLGVMAERGITRREMAKRIGISNNTMCHKIAGLKRLTLSEVVDMRNVLELTDEQAIDIFLR